MKGIRRRLVSLALLGCACIAARAETCTTQSQMDAGVKEALKGAATSLAEKMQAGDQAGVRAMTIAEYAKDFSGLGRAMQAVAPRLKGGAVEVEQVYLLDGSNLKRNADGSEPNAEFYCSLNKSPAEAEFDIPGLPPGRYGFAIVRVASAKPWRLSLLLRQDGGAWLLAGFYPKALTAGGHDGLWYWTQARKYEAEKHGWDAWLYFQEAQNLLQPANFVDSTHLDALKKELAGATPTAVSQLGTETPLVLKGLDGVEYRFTAMTVDDSLGLDKVDVALRLKVDALGDAATARARNVAAMKTILVACPELRGVFHGVWVYAEAAGQNPYGTELSMAEIP